MLKAIWASSLTGIVELEAQLMWPLTNHRSFSSSALNELAQRYREHLETLPADRLLLFQTEEFDYAKGSVSSALEQDCARSVKRFEQQIMTRIAGIQEVRPGLSKHHFFISVLLRPAVGGAEGVGLPEFFDGYIVDVTPQIILPKLR